VVWEKLHGDGKGIADPQGIRIIQSKGKKNELGGALNEGGAEKGAVRCAT